MEVAVADPVTFAEEMDASPVGAPVPAAELVVVVVSVPVSQKSQE